MKDEMPVTSRQVLDPEMLVTAIRHADLEPCQLSPRPVLSTIARVMCRRVCLELVSVGPAMLYTGVMPKDCFTLSFVMSNPGVGRSFNFGMEFGGGGYMGFFPPGAALDAANPEDCKDAVLTVPSEVFLAAAEQRRIRGLLDSIETIVESNSVDLGRECICRHIESDLLLCFLAALRDGCGQGLKSYRLRVAGRHRRFRRIREYVAEHLHQPLHLDDICRETGLSAGGTENVFRDFLGIGPIALLRHQRLHCARRTLLREDPCSGAVKKAAFDAGFLHMGRFSRDCRSLFGESPRETLLTVERN